MQKAEYFEALGIVRYRRRELRVVETASSVDTAPEKVRDSNTRPALNRVASAPVTSDLQPPAPADSNTQSQMPGQQLSFDLLIWKTGKLLVWEFSREQAELASAKHRLVNNVLKALWPSGFEGVQMLQQNWPLPGVNASKTSASDWLASTLSGHLQQSDAAPVWLMGDIGLELILGQQDSYDDMLGSRVKHPQLELELFI
ncbi:MAG: hypothetical protein RLN96_10760, partial [Pseudomonadales bacterium]